MELKDFTGKPCRNKSAFEFLPKQRQDIELEQIATVLREKGIQIEADTPFVLMLRVEGHSISMFKTGKILIKNLKEEKKARAIAEQLVQNF